MGWPAHPLVAFPTLDPDVLAAVAAARADPQGVRPSLLTATTGHLCATAWVTDPGGGQVLLLAHPTLGWSVPGGHVEAGEHPWAAARRELREETGIVVPAGGEIPPAALVHRSTFPGTAKGPAHVHWFLGYRFTADPAAPLIDGHWFPRRRLPDGALEDLTVLLAALG